jgi:hypothetical protein
MVINEALFVRGAMAQRKCERAVWMWAEAYLSFAFSFLTFLLAKQKKSKIRGTHERTCAVISMQKTLRAN